MVIITTWGCACPGHSGISEETKCYFSAFTGEFTLQTSPETVLGGAPLCAQVCKLRQANLHWIYHQYNPFTTTTLPGGGAWWGLGVGGGRLWVSRSGVGNPYSAFLLKIILENNYFTILWWFLPHININQPQVYLVYTFCISNKLPGSHCGIRRAR